MFVTKKQKGVSLYFAILIMGILLGIGIGLSTILIPQLKMTRELGDSVIALMAADTGIERALYAIYKQTTSFPFSFSGYLDLNKNGIQDPKEPTFEVQGFVPGPNCSATYYCLKSIGSYKETKRAIEAFF